MCQNITMTKLLDLPLLDLLPSMIINNSIYKSINGLRTVSTPYSQHIEVNVKHSNPFPFHAVRTYTRHVVLPCFVEGNRLLTSARFLRHY